MRGRFFDRWILSSKLPRLRIQSEVDEAASAATVRVEQLGDIFDLPLTVRLQYTDGRIEEVLLHVSDRTVSERIPLNGRLRRIVAKDERVGVAAAVGHAGSLRVDDRCRLRVGELDADRGLAEDAGDVVVTSQEPATEEVRPVDGVGRPQPRVLRVGRLDEPWLERIERRPDPVTEALGKSLRVVHRPHVEEGIELLAATLGGDSDMDVRIAAARELRRFADPVAYESLGLALQEDDPALQLGGSAGFPEGDSPLLDVPVVELEEGSAESAASLLDLPRSSGEVGAVDGPEEGPHSSHVAEQLAEADVYQKYGLEEKARERLLEVVHVAPDNLTARRRLKAIYRDRRQAEEACAETLAMLMMLPRWALTMCSKA